MTRRVSSRRGVFRHGRVASRQAARVVGRRYGSGAGRSPLRACTRSTRARRLRRSSSSKIGEIALAYSGFHKAAVWLHPTWRVSCTRRSPLVVWSLLYLYLSDTVPSRFLCFKE
eukprot:6185308-Pleurochrysis_carterae.AAC.1